MNADKQDCTYALACDYLPDSTRYELLRPRIRDNPLLDTEDVSLDNLFVAESFEPPIVIKKDLFYSLPVVEDNPFALRIAHLKGDLRFKTSLVDLCADYNNFVWSQYFRLFEQGCSEQIREQNPSLVLMDVCECDLLILSLDDVLKRIAKDYATIGEDFSLFASRIELARDVRVADVHIDMRFW